MSALLDFMRDNHILVEIEQTIAEKNATLELNNYEMKHIPSLLYECRTLKHLFLHKNSINCLHGDVSNLTNLTTLTLDFNNLTNLPREIGLLKSLVILNVSYNPIRKLPLEIFGLEQLEEFWCNKIELEELPREIANLKTLDTFGARNNNLKVLPDEICLLKTLRWLTLENNMIEYLPERIGDMEALTHCNFNRNLVKKIPKSFEECKKLAYLLFKGNDIEKLPDDFDATKMSALVMIDLQNNPIGRTFNRIHPKIRYTSIWPIPSQPRLENTQTTDLPSDQNTEMAVDTENNQELQEIESNTSDSDWENSIGSSRIDNEYQTDEEQVDNGVRSFSFLFARRRFLDGESQQVAASHNYAVLALFHKSLTSLHMSKHHIFLTNFVGAFIPELSRFAATSN